MCDALDTIDNAIKQIEQLQTERDALHDRAVRAESVIVAMATELSKMAIEILQGMNEES